MNSCSMTWIASGVQATPIALMVVSNGLDYWRGMPVAMLAILAVRATRKQHTEYECYARNANHRGTLRTSIVGPESTTTP